MMRGSLRAAPAALLALACAGTPAAASPSAGCRFPSVDLGPFMSGDRSIANFADERGGAVQVGGARRFHAVVSGCDAGATYRLTTGTSAPIHVTNGSQSIDLVPFVVAVNGTPLPVPIDLTRPNELVLTGNPDLEIVAAYTVAPNSLAVGRYGGGFVMQFVDP